MAHIFFRTKRQSQEGWTLAELLIVIVIIAILVVMFLLINWKKNIFRAQDTRRKADVANIRRAFEEYYNDNDCYPPIDVLANCGSETSDLSPYLRKIPCDPTTQEPYKYQPDSDTNVCLGNRVCTHLQDTSDPDIATLGCSGEEGCGWGASWNYCVAAGTTVTAPAGYTGGGSVTTSTPTPTPLLNGSYACRPGTLAGGQVVASGTCNDVGDPTVYGCPMSFVENDCQGLCVYSNYWCTQ